MKRYRTTLLLLLVTIFFLVLLVVIYQSGVRVETPPVRHSDSKPGNNSGSNMTIYVSGDVCEGCHLSGKPFIPQALKVGAHTGGGAYCLSCHKISHETHPINDNVTCEKCHGTTAGIPVFVNGTISCNNCHGYPDPLTPSGGNLITIHRQRGTACTNCHTAECTKCHAEIGTSVKWEKRLTHFRTIVGTIG